MAFFPYRVSSLADVNLARDVSLYLFGVGDPGNLGTLVRSGVAFAARGVITSPGTADPFSPKALRAGMGAQFHLPVVEEVAPGDLQARLLSVASKGGQPPTVVMADPHAELGIEDYRPAGAVLLVLGAERGALPELEGDIRRVAIKQVHMDSLNVAMAGTILLYELRRRSPSALPSGQGA
jgi:TrmH family RNA methyltransferase